MGFYDTLDTLNGGRPQPKKGGFYETLQGLNADQAESDAAEPRGPLDPLTPKSPLGGALKWLQVHTPEQVKYPFTAVGNFLNDRLSAGAAALWEPLAPAFQSVDQAAKEEYAREAGTQPPAPLPQAERMRSIPDQLGQVYNAFVHGTSPIEGVPPKMAMDELARRTLGEYHAITPEQADAISRASLGLPTGEVARALTGNEGGALLAQGPALEAMNAIGGAAYPIAQGIGRRIPGKGTDWLRAPLGLESQQRNTLDTLKRAATQRALAEQAESALELDAPKAATLAIAKQTGESFEQVDRRIRNAMELEARTGGRSLASLPSAERQVAQMYRQHGAGQITMDVQEDLRPGILGSHIEDLRTRALDKIAQADPRTPFGPRPIKPAQIQAARNAVRRLEKKVAPSGIAAARTVGGRRIDLDAAEGLLQKLPTMLASDAPRAVLPQAAEDLASLRGQLPKGAAMGNVGRFTAAAEPVRQGNRAMTALEKEAAFQQAAGPAKQGIVSRILRRPPEERKLWRTMYEAAIIRGNRRALRRASAGWLRDIGDEFGVQVLPGQVKPGYVPLLSIGKMGKSGFNALEKEALSTVHVPRDIAIKVTRMNERLRTASLGEAANFLRTGARAWKTYVLARPGYFIRNLTDNVMASWLFGAKAEHLPDAMQAAALAHGGKLAAKINPNRYIPSLRMTLGEYVKEARRNGTLSGGFLSSDITAPKPGAVAFRPGERMRYAANVAGAPLRGFQTANAISENTARVVLDMTERAAGRTAQEAGDLVGNTLGRYHPAYFGPKEQFVRTYLAPWYAWAKQVVTRGSRAIATRPGSVAQIESAIHEVNRSQGYTPEYTASLGPSGKGDVPILRPNRRPGALPGDVEAFPTSFYGLRDINRMFGTRELGPLAVLINPAGQLYPPAQWLAAIGGVDTFRGSNFTGESVELPNIAKAIMKAAPDLADKLGMHMVGERAFGPDRLSFFLRQSGPAGMAVGDLSSSDPESVARARAFLTGFSAIIRNPQESQRIQFFQERSARKEQANTLQRSRRNEYRSLERQRAARPGSQPQP